MDPTWGSCPGSVPRHLMLEDKAILQVLERPPPSPNMALDFLGSPVQRGYGGSSRLKCPDLRLMSPKPFPQCFLQQSLPLLYSPLNEVVGEMTFSKLVEVLQELTRPLPESSELPLTMALKNQFGISLLYSLLSHGERLLSSHAPLKPCRGDFEAWTDTVYLMSQELSRLPTASLAEPLFLPSNLVLLFCRYLDKQTVYHLAAKMAE
ncbi:hypothetical protein EK904_003127 [Melospiza melodia maxima]|nr:hypothetical protein EK904_003127 [Melospiza melodia maxima]